MEAVTAWLSHSDPATPHIAAYSRRQPPPFNPTAVYVTAQGHSPGRLPLPRYHQTREGTHNSTFRRLAHSFAIIADSSVES